MILTVTWVTGLQESWTCAIVLLFCCRVAWSCPDSHSGWFCERDDCKEILEVWQSWIVWVFAPLVCKFEFPDTSSCIMFRTWNKSCPIPVLILGVIVTIVRLQKISLKSFIIMIVVMMNSIYATMALPSYVCVAYLRVGTVMATLPDARCCEVSTRTGWPESVYLG